MSEVYQTQPRASYCNVEATRKSRRRQAKQWMDRCKTRLKRLELGRENCCKHYQGENSMQGLCQKFIVSNLTDERRGRSSGKYTPDQKYYPDVVVLCASLVNLN